MSFYEEVLITHTSDGVIMLDKLFELLYDYRWHYMIFMQKHFPLLMRMQEDLFVLLHIPIQVFSLMQNKKKSFTF